MLELMIMSPKENEILPEIEFNYEQIKSAIETELKAYEALEISIENLPNIKSTLAELRKIKEKFEVRRIAAKKQWMQPFENFEKKYKNVLSLLDEQINDLGEKTKTFETKIKEEKKVKIKTYYEKEAVEIIELLPFEKIYNPKWLNAGCKSKSIQEEIQNAILKFKADFLAIKNLKTKYEAQIIDAYLLTGSLTTALNENVRLAKQEQDLKLVEEKRNAQRAKELELEDLNRVYGKEKADTAPEPAKTAVNEEKKEERVFVLKLEIKATKEQLEALKEFLKEKGIEFKKGE